MKNTRVGFYLVHVFIALMVFTACAKDDFRQACLDSTDTLENARNLLAKTTAREVIEKGKPVSHTTTFDNTKAKEYLESKEKELSGYYQNIKNNLEKSNKNYADSLYVLALINEMTFLFSGKAIEDRCHYLRKINGEGKHDLSGWVIDEVFGPVMFSDKSILKEWSGRSHKEKYEDTYRFLMVPSGKGEKCP
jgi:hypothetical protein